MPTEIVQTKTYVKTFLALLGLLALTVGASFLNLGPFAIVVALGIAIVKATLIFLIFMEVRYSSPMVWLFSAAAFVWLMLLLILSMSDYATRDWSAPDWRNATNGVNHVEFTAPPPNGEARER